MHKANKLFLFIEIKISGYVGTINVQTCCSPDRNDLPKSGTSAKQFTNILHMICAEKLNYIKLLNYQKEE